MIKKAFLFLLFGLTFYSISFCISKTVQKVIVYYHNTVNIEKSLELSNGISDENLSSLVKAYLFLADSVEKFYGKSESYIEKLIKYADEENLDLYEVVKLLKIWRFDSITKLDGKFEELLLKFPDSLIVVLEAMRFHHYNYTHYFYESSYKTLERLFNIATRLDPGVSSPYIWIINAKKIKEEDVEPFISEAIKNADCKVLRRFLATFYFEKGDYEKAVENSKVVPDFEKDSEILYIIGISLWKLQKFEEALTFLEMLIDNEDFEKLYFKKQAQVYRAAGDIYEKREDIKTAVEYYKKAVKKDSNDSETFKALGMAYLKTSDPDKEIYARYYLNLALKISPNLSDAEKVLKEINKKFVRVAFLKYMFPVLMIVIILLVLLEFSIKLKKKKGMRRLMK